jgi:hypothetical protein
MPYVIDPTIPKQHQKESDSMPAKNRWYYFYKKLRRIIWLGIIIIIGVQCIFIGIKLTSSRPDERMCLEDSMCFNYCGLPDKSVCLSPAALDTHNTKEAIKLLLTGKRNIIEVLNPGQKYCACERVVGKEKMFDVFYRFYADNNP